MTLYLPGIYAGQLLSRPHPGIAGGPQDQENHQYHQNITEFLGAEDSFDIPYHIQKGFYYHVEGVPKGKEGKPTIMWLKDYNGDGHAWEFALFDAIACMGLPTTLIGYSEAQDRVIQYPVDLTIIPGNKNPPRTWPYGWIISSASPRSGRDFGNMPLITGGEPGPWMPMRSATARQKRNSPASWISTEDDS